MSIKHLFEYTKKVSVLFLIFFVFLCPTVATVRKHRESTSKDNRGGIAVLFEYNCGVVYI